MSQNTKIHIKKYNTKITIPIQFPLKVCPGVLDRLRKICILQSPESFNLLRKIDRNFCPVGQFVLLI